MPRIAEPLVNGVARQSLSAPRDKILQALSASDISCQVQLTASVLAGPLVVPRRTATATMATPHLHDGLPTHSHSHEFNAAEHGHSHEILDGPGSYAGREMPIIADRDWHDRAFTVGIGG